MQNSYHRIFYRASGLIRGKYLPTEDDLNQGILMTEQGVFPASITETMLHFLTKNPKKKTYKNNIILFALFKV